jgi:hypothetical protein
MVINHLIEWVERKRHERSRVGKGWAFCSKNKSLLAVGI